MRDVRLALRHALTVTVVGIAACLLAATPLSAQTAETTVSDPSFEDVLSLEYLRGYDLSPDGSGVAYEVQTTNWEENRYDREIWLWRQCRDAIRLTRSPKGTSRSPRWSPDGTWIAFLSNRDEEQQIHLIRADGGEATTLTSHEEGVNSFRWSPDGLRIAFSASDPADSLDEKLEERYGAYSVEDDDDARTHLWVVVVVADSASEPERLTESAAFTVNGFDWSPDGTRIGFGHAPTGSITARGDISVLDVETREITPVTTGPGSEGRFEWSPDGEWILYASAGADTTSDYYLNSRLWKVRATGTGDPVQLAAELDESIGRYWWTEQGIFVVAWQGTERRMYEVDPESGAVREFADVPERIWGLDFSADGFTMALDASTGTTLPELYLTEVSHYDPVRITHFSDQIASWKVGTSEVIR